MIFTIVELLLIALLLMCNCLNLVSVLGFNTHQVRPIAADQDSLATQQPSDDYLYIDSYINEITLEPNEEARDPVYLKS